MEQLSVCTRAVTFGTATTWVARKKEKGQQSLPGTDCFNHEYSSPKWGDWSFHRSSTHSAEITVTACANKPPREVNRRWSTAEGAKQTRTRGLQQQQRGLCDLISFSKHWAWRALMAGTSIPFAGCHVASSRAPCGPSSTNLSFCLLLDGCSNPLLPALLGFHVNQFCIKTPQNPSLLVLITSMLAASLHVITKMNGERRDERV